MKDEKEAKDDSPSIWGLIVLAFVFLFFGD